MGWSIELNRITLKRLKKGLKSKKSYIFCLNEGKILESIDDPDINLDFALPNEEVKFFSVIFLLSKLRTSLVKDYLVETK